MKTNNSSGFTLVEVLISILMLAIVLTGGMALYHNASEIMAHMVHKKVAMELADLEMEGIKELTYNSIIPLDETTITGAPLANAKKTITVTEVDAKYKEVGVKVAWKDNSKSVELLTYIAK